MKNLRIDTCRLDKHEITDEGFLKTKAYATRTGIFLYLMDDGTLRREYRPAEEVFKADSMNSLKGKPITNDHPSEFVTSLNSRYYSVGLTGDSTKKEKVDGEADEFLGVPLTVTDQETINNIRVDGKVEVSCGYTCDVFEEAGEYNGEPYDTIQRNIKYNHLAVVDRGRAGPNAKLRLDSFSKKDGESLGVQRLESDLKNDTRKEDDMKEVEFKLGGIKYKTDDSGMAQSVLKLAEDHEALKTDLKEVQTEKETLQGKCDELEKTITDLKKEVEDSKPSHSELLKMAKDRADLETVASEVMDKEFKADELTDIEIKKAVVEKHADCSLEGKTDAYVEGRFDSFKANFSKENKAKEDVKDAFKKRDEEVKTNDSDWREDAKKSDSQAWMKSAEEANK